MPAHPLLLNGHQLVAVDIETTGLHPGHHDIIQIAMVPVTPDLQPDLGRAGNWVLQPAHPARANPIAMQVNGFDLDDLCLTAPSAYTIQDRIDEWVADFQLAEGKGLIPLAHNWAFEYGFLSTWWGLEHFNLVFTRRARDTMILAASLGDQAEILGHPYPFPSLSLGELTKHYGIVNERPHDALYDCIATIHLYRHLLTHGVASGDGMT